MKSLYRYFLLIPTRWKDNDIFGHVNNVEYYSFIDTGITTYLVREGGLDIHQGSVIAVCADSHCRFKRPIAFPEAVEAGLRVAHIGRSSVRYEIGLFGLGSDDPIAEAWFVHVFLDRTERKPQPLPDALRSALERLSRRGDPVSGNQ
jgi:acyl-CoA thioester hydrolase